MIRNESGNASSFSRLLDQVNEVSEMTENAILFGDTFKQLSSFMRRIFSILREVQDCLRHRTSSISILLQPIELEIKNAKELINICKSKSKFYILIHLQSFQQHIQEIFRSLASSLIRISSANVDVGLDLKNKIKRLCEDLQSVEVRMSREESDLMIEINGLSSGVVDVDPKHSNELLRKMAMVSGVSLDPSSLKHEYEGLKREKEMILSNNHESDVLRLQHVITVLSSANALGSATTERSQRYQEQRRSLDSDLISPLQTFYCPITQEVMEDPVEIESGQTFERSAIQRWFDDGNKVCPITKMELKTFTWRSNRLLKQSIEEWKDMNTNKKIMKFVVKLSSEDEETVRKALLEIQSVCEENPKHKYWVAAAEGLIPLLVDLLGSSKRELRKHVLVTLGAITADNSENRVALCNAGAIEYVVRSLARDASEARHAVSLLSELSKEELSRERISKVQGCILLLVTITNCEAVPSAANAKEILELLSNSDENVVLMANANYFKPLVKSLREGSSTTQITMASTLAAMQLSDQSRTQLVQLGVLKPLVEMLTIGNIDNKSSALGALKCLSISSRNRDPMIEAGVMQPLLEILFTMKSVAAIIKEHAAAIFANLAMASQSFGISELWGPQRNTDETILQLMALLNLAGPNTQSHVLRALFYICSHSASTAFRETLRDSTCIQLLVRLMDVSMEVRLYALKLLFVLTRDGGDVLSRELTDDFYKALVNLFSSDALEEEKAAAMGILGNLPLYKREVTQKMLETGILASIVSVLEKACSRASGRSNTALVEHASWALVRFTLPTDIELQLYTVKANVIPLLVNLLDFGTTLTKSRAAMSLQQLSESTPKLCKPFNTSRGWFSCFRPPQELGCVLHKGPCSVNGTFCLLEAEAISPLIQALEDKDEEVDDAVLGALITIIADEYWEKGADLIVKHDGVKPIIRELTVGNPGVQEKALLILEKILRKESYKTQFGSIAQMPLVSLTQDGTSITRPLAAKILAHLNILHEQSSYF